LPAPDGPTIATVCRPAPRSYALQDWPRRLIGEAHVLEANAAARTASGLASPVVISAGRCRMLNMVRCRWSLLDLAIDHAHEVQRLVELDHHGVDHDEIADGVGTGADAVGAHHHGHREPDGEDHAWPA